MTDTQTVLQIFSDHQTPHTAISMAVYLYGRGGIYPEPGKTEGMMRRAEIALHELQEAGKLRLDEGGWYWLNDSN